MTALATQSPDELQMRRRERSGVMHTRITRYVCFYDDPNKLDFHFTKVS
uniref:Uncharacterized protein n=1 Tax=Picea glauca TaxID=3330 RepID=A0A101M2J6_PICGL|nr:hypothetical protein ABT39_MTgene2906 [Picea glauca]